MPRRGNNTRNAAEETQDKTEVEELNEAQTDESTPGEGRFEESDGSETIVDERETAGKTGDGYPQQMSDYTGDKINVETTGDFQLYDATTLTLFPHDKSVEVPENSQFVQRNISRGKLKKV